MARIRIRDVEAAVCQHFNLTPADLKGRSRFRRIARPRQITMFLCRELTGQSLTQIGTYFNRDHTTVIHASDRITELLTQKPKVAEYVDLCRALVRPEFQPETFSGPLVMAAE